ncbi:MAG TPA: peptidoglycan-associated lipoprotein Pal [Bryobacteraceae bacterium]|nr:peptidoglycan-associated lipoprotein Pal [Bryobacteraceae bacterium]
MITKSTRPYIKIGAVTLALTLAIFAVSCKKKAPPPPPPPPPPSAPPSIAAPSARPVINSFTAEPSAIDRGQSSTLRWSISGATDMNIDQGVGAVQSQGSRQVFPNNSTTYTLTASGPGGTDSRSATVTVSSPAPPPPPANTGPRLSSSELLQQQAQDAYFDYDKSDIRSDARDALTRDATLLKQIFAQDPQFTVVVEGHCDERGSAEYNLALGDRRASSARDFLVQLGVPSDRLKTISYGKERPQCTEANESCWQRNRRAHLSPGQ